MKNLITLIALAFTSAAHATDYYPLICKGGAGIKVDQTLNVYPGAGVGNVLMGDLSVDFSFIKGTIAATEKGANLPAGTCSWMDRGLNRDEPSKLLYSSSAITGEVVRFEIFTSVTSTGSVSSIHSTLSHLVYNNISMKMYVTTVGDHFELKPMSTIEIYNSAL